MSDRVLRIRGSGELPWALVEFVDQDGCDSGACGLRGPLPDTVDDDAVEAFVAGRPIVGICSRGVFPARSPLLQALLGLHGESRPFRYVERVRGWAHCFRRPDLYLPAGSPRILLSESDFKDPEWIWRIAGQEGRPVKRWDVVCVGGTGAYHEVTKNASLGMSCVLRLCSQLGFRALLVDGPAHAAADIGAGRLELTGQLVWHELLECIAQSRLALFPNGLDPSPRLLAETLCLDVPVLVNRDILGGWKYVTPETGAFFDGEDDLVQTARRMIGSSYSARAWFTAHHGPLHAGRRLAGFLKTLDNASAGAALDDTGDDQSSDGHPQ